LEELQEEMQNMINEIQNQEKLSEHNFEYNHNNHNHKCKCGHEH